MDKNTIHYVICELRSDEVHQEFLDEIYNTLTTHGFSWGWGSDEPDNGIERLGIVGDRELINKLIPTLEQIKDKYNIQ